MSTVMNAPMLILVLAMVLPSAVFGATAFGEIKTEKVNGHIVRYCEYEKVKLLPGSVIKDYDTCYRCACTKSGLSCASISYRVTVHDENPTCINIVVGCKNRWVYADDNNKRCPKDKRPKNISAVGK